jgi:hypothetical protein
MNRNVRHTKVVDGLVDSVRELNEGNVWRAAYTADTADAAGPSVAQASRGLRGIRM